VSFVRIAYHLPEILYGVKVSILELKTKSAGAHQLTFNFSLLPFRQCSGGDHFPQVATRGSENEALRAIMRLIILLTFIS
jgi:hypothetical protein